MLLNLEYAVKLSIKWKERTKIFSIHEFKDLCHMCTFLESTGECALSSKMGEFRKEEVIESRNRGSIP